MALSKIAYKPSKPAARTTTPPPKEYQNADGPGGRTIDYGPAKGPSQQERRDALEAEWGLSPWYGRGGELMPWSGPDAQRGQRTPMFTPDAGDPRNAGYFVEETPEQAAQWAQMHGAAEAAQNARYAANPEIMAARNAGDLKGMIAAVQRMKAQGQQQRFVDQGGSPETWNNRFNTAWPVPASPTGNYQYGPGRPGPTPPGVAGGGAPTGRNGGRGGLIEGYVPDAPASRGMSTGAGAAMPYEPGMGGAGQIGGAMGGQFNPMMLQAQMGWGYAPSMAMATQGRTFPGGGSPVNPGPIGGRPTTGPVPAPIPYPSGPRDFNSIFGLGAGGVNAAPFSMNAFGMPPGMDLGMMGFGYRPTY